LQVTPTQSVVQVEVLQLGQVVSSYGYSHTPSVHVPGVR
jgi:hypothetical protein